MSTVTADQVKELREKTGVSMMECRNALVETHGDKEKAIDVLRKKGIAKASSKADRVTKEGLLGSYVHSNGKIGVIVEVLCETDFVAKNDNFKTFAKDLAMHVAAANPLYLKRDEVPADVITREKGIHAEAVKGKPENVAQKILDGKMDKYYSDVCLMEQKFVKDDKLSITDLLASKIQEIGEKIVIRRFVRLDLGA